MLLPHSQTPNFIAVSLESITIKPWTTPSQKYFLIVSIVWFFPLLFMANTLCAQAIKC